MHYVANATLPITQATISMMILLQTVSKKPRGCRKTLQLAQR
jgi:hypothetical protein